MRFFSDKNKKAAAQAQCKTKDSAGKNIFSLARYIYPISISLGTVLTLAVMYFLYLNVYKTIGQAEIVTNLKGKVAEEQLNESRFSQIIEKIKSKSSRAKDRYDQLKDPTDYETQSSRDSAKEAITESAQTSTTDLQ